MLNYNLMCLIYLNSSTEHLCHLCNMVVTCINQFRQMIMIGYRVKSIFLAFLLILSSQIGLFSKAIIAL